MLLKDAVLDLRKGRRYGVAAWLHMQHTHTLQFRSCIMVMGWEIVVTSGYYIHQGSPHCDGFGSLDPWMVQGGQLS